MQLLSVVALLVTILLIQAHYQSSEAGSFCNINDTWNCDRVNKSTFAEIMGVPVSIFGFLYYAFISALYFGLNRGFDFNKKFQPLSTKWMLRGMTLISTLVLLGLLFQEMSLLRENYWVAVIKTIFFLSLNYYIYSYCQKNPHPKIDFLGFTAMLALFGVVFSLYLTDIEIFVLQAFCIFCVSQQIIIATIAFINILVLRKSKNEHPPITEPAA